jgi:pimeloyl-ACP methyl ester carboxylesterase
MFFASPVFAATTPFRSANIVTANGIPSYTNLNNCSATDGNTCDRATASGYANLYFRDFGNYADFGMPQGSIITKIRIRVTGKSHASPFAPGVGLSSGTIFQVNCQSPVDLWGLSQLNNIQTVNSQTFTASVVEESYINGTVLAYCLQPYNIENKSYIFRINNSSAQNWSANIDNFEIAFDYESGLTPTPTLTPIPTSTPTPISTPGKTPLILIPGIAGSELKTTDMRIWAANDGHMGIFTNIYLPNETVWPSIPQAILSSEDDYFDVLRMKVDGLTSEASVETNGNLVDFAYQKTKDFFLSNGYVLGKDFFLFPYDWRKDISLTAPLLDQEINDIKTQTGSTKVDIVAHSMGGLVARNYISDLSRAQNVRKLFTLGTPHLGSVKFLQAINYGICLKFEIGPACLSIARSEVKDIIQNMISGYELAPSQEYFNFYNGQDKSHLPPYKNNGETLNYNGIKSLLATSGHNVPLFSPSESFHELDNSLTNTNGVEVTNIAGSGLETLGQIREKSAKNFLGNIIQKKDGFSINGDKTVPLFSASLINGSKSLLGDAKVFYTKQEHGELVAPGPALNLVKNILNDNYQSLSGVSTQPYSFRGTEISIYSPVNIHAYDSFGNHTGPINDGDFEINIPGSSYDTLDDAKFIFLPNDGIYDLKFEATGQGSFDFKIRRYENDSLVREILYKDIPLTALAKAYLRFDTSSDYSPEILLDKNGDGSDNQYIDFSSNLTGDVIYDEIPPKTDFQIYGILGDNGWFKSDVNVTLIPQYESMGSGVLKTEYSLDNGQTINLYTKPFEISAEKINKLKFRSVDNAGNEEDVKEAEIKIDKTPPQITLEANPKILWPANNKMIDVKITGRSFDINPVITQIVVSDEYQKIEPLIADFGQTIKLQASRNGNDLNGRKYTIKAISEDLAGNISAASVDVIVPHDQGD